MLKRLTTLTTISLVLLLTSCGDDIETESVCMQLDTSVQRHVIRDYQYARYRIFDVGRSGASNYLGNGDSILEFRLYQSAESFSPELPEAIAYVNVIDPESSTDSVDQRFRELVYGIDYELWMNPDAGKHAVFFLAKLQNIQTTTIAYYMVVKKADGASLQFGDLSQSRYRLQMLKRSNPIPTDLLWDSEWKNVYDYGFPLTADKLITIDIYKGSVGDEDNQQNPSGQNGQKYVTLLNLDSVDTFGDSIPDGRIDREHIMKEYHLLVFPDRRPFASAGLSDDAVPLIYETLNATELNHISQYYLDVTEQHVTWYRLDHINLVEDSEVIRLDGRKLTRSIHYWIDYETGVVEFIGDTDFLHSVLDSRDLEVCYEYWK